MVIKDVNIFPSNIPSYKRVDFKVDATNEEGYALFDHACMLYININKTVGGWTNMHVSSDTAMTDQKVMLAIAAIAYP